MIAPHSTKQKKRGFSRVIQLFFRKGQAREQQRHFSFAGLPYFILAAFIFIASSNTAWAVDADDIAENIVRSTELVPGLITAISYALGILLGILGVLKLKEHVDNPQTPLRTGFIRLIAGGALFSLPLVYEAMETSFNLGVDNPNKFETGISDLVSIISGGLSSFIPTLNVNSILSNIVESVERMPGIVTATAYILGLVLGVTGITKLKEHVEDPSRAEIKEGVIRLLVGGALFALPTIFSAMFNAFSGGDGIGGISSFISGLGSFNWFYSSAAGTIACNPVKIPLIGGLLGSSSLGNVVCNLLSSTTLFPAFLTAMGYLFGTFLGLWGVLRVKEHVLNPQQVQIWDPVSKFLAGGLSSPCQLSSKQHARALHRTHCPQSPVSQPQPASTKAVAVVAYWVQHSASSALVADVRLVGVA